MERRGKKREKGREEKNIEGNQRNRKSNLNLIQDL